MNEMARPLTVLLSVLLLSGGVLPAPALAKSSQITVNGPGFLVEEKKGWFGTSQRTYKDALGNTYVKKRGLFGRESTEGSLMGSKISRQGQNVSVLGPDGQPLITKKKTFWGREETHIDGNQILNNVKSLFQSATPAP